MSLNTLLAVSLLTLSFFSAADANETSTDINSLAIENAWIAEAPPVSKVMAAYLTIKNNGKKPIKITSAESEQYSSIEFHETVHEDGLARMIRHTNMEIPANDELVLKRGGQHLMLFNPVKPLKSGDTVTIKLITDNKTVKTISVPVKKAQH